MTRYLVEFGLDSPIDKNTEKIKIVDGDKEVIFDFDGSNGYTGEPNIKIIVPSENLLDTLTKAGDFFVPYLNKIMLIYRFRIVLKPSHSHYIIEGSIGKTERKCFVSNLWKKTPSFSYISQKEIDSVLITNFPNANDLALAYFRLAKLSSSTIDEFRNLRLALESLVSPRLNEIRTCNYCKEKLYCKSCKEAITFTTVLDKDLESFWVNEIGGFIYDIKNINKLRQKTFHSTDLKKIYTPDAALNKAISSLEIWLGQYFTKDTKFWQMYADYGENYYSEETFNTKFPHQEFPEDFPKEDYWRKKIPSH